MQGTGASLISSSSSSRGGGSQPPLVPLPQLPLAGWHPCHRCRSPWAAAAAASGCAPSCRAVWSAMLCCGTSLVGTMTYPLPLVSSMRQASRHRWRSWATPRAGLCTDDSRAMAACARALGGVRCSFNVGRGGAVDLCVSAWAGGGWGGIGWAAMEQGCWQPLHKAVCNGMFHLCISHVLCPLVLRSCECCSNTPRMLPHSHSWVLRVSGMGSTLVICIASMPALWGWSSVTVTWRCVHRECNSAMFACRLLCCCLAVPGVLSAVKGVAISTGVVWPTSIVRCLVSR